MDSNLSYLDKMVIKMLFLQKGRIFFTRWPKFWAISGRKMLKRVGNTAYVLGGGGQPPLSAQPAAAALWRLRPAAAVIVSAVLTVRSPPPPLHDVILPPCQYTLYMCKHSKCIYSHWEGGELTVFLQSINSVKHQ